VAAGLPAALCLLFATAAARAAEPPSAGAELRAARAFEAARRQGPAALRIFLSAMPKGADLHNHLAGAVYAESWIRAAGEDGLCVDTQTLTLVPGPGSASGPRSGPVCGERLRPASDAALDPQFYDRLIDAFSMRSFVPAAGLSAHDQFFSTFARFELATLHHAGRWIDETAALAARENNQYLELMVTPDFSASAGAATAAGWPAEYDALRGRLLSETVAHDVGLARRYGSEALAERSRLEHCGTPEAQPACAVTVRLLYQVLRGMAPEAVFAQLLVAFETAASDADYAGINMVMPEDGYLAMRDYAEQMRMVAYLHGLYPGVHIALHAGELAEGLVPPPGLGFHIRSAVEVARAERIGHGVDLPFEQDAARLLEEMASRHVLVEINLTSNDVILGVRGRRHPLMLYRRYGVPVSLSTDDEGVSRADITAEFVKAATDFPLSYQDLKQMARAGLEHSFLPGRSLWSAPDDFRRPARECAGTPGSPHPAPACAALLAGSEKARQQWELERRFRVFESRY